MNAQSSMVQIVRTMQTGMMKWQEIDWKAAESYVNRVVAERGIRWK